MNFSNTTVVIPTLNEEKNIGKLISILNGLYANIKIIVVDDGSEDKTQGIVKDVGNVKLIDRSNKKVKGLTASVVDGVKSVKDGNVIVIDADFQHPPEKIKEIVEKLKKNDIVIGTRKSLPNDWSLVRKAISETARLLGKIRLIGKEFNARDVASGFFGVRTNLMKCVLDKYEKGFEKKGYKVLFDLLKYCPSGMKVGEVYYDFRLREKGSSKINKTHIWIYFRSLFK